MRMTLLADHQVIETERLLLRRVATDDLPFYTRIHADPDVARYIAHGKPRSPDETRTWLGNLLDAYRETSLGQLAVTRKSDGALVGRCGLSYLETDRDAAPDGIRTGYYFPERANPDSGPVVESELGYTFDRDVWGHGYATEAVRGVSDYARANRPGECLVSLIHADNVRSRKLAERFGVARTYPVMLWGRAFDRYVWPAANSPSTER
jgi:RimJ/RimL family protein N-acetyltransferase